MTKFKIKLKKIGREHFSKTFKVNVRDLDDAEFLAYKEADKHLISSNTALIPTRKKGEYIVSAGLQTVGEVEIKKVK